LLVALAARQWEFLNSNNRFGMPPWRRLLHIGSLLFGLAAGSGRTVFGIQPL